MILSNREAQPVSGPAFCVVPGRSVLEIVRFGIGLLALVLVQWCSGCCDLYATAVPHFTHISVEQGLSQSTVQAILQDHAGYIWMGTEEGLNRYDGYTFTIFKHDPQNPHGLPDDIVSALYEDREHRLWVGTQEGLSLFDRRTETFTAVPEIQQKVSGILEAADGTLWVATQGAGLFSRAASAEKFTNMRHDDHDAASLASSNLTTLFFDRA